MEIRDKLEDGIQDVHEKYMMCNTRVYRKHRRKFLLYVPPDLKYDIFSEAHRG